MNHLTGTVRIVGAGLLGTSIGLALTKQGFDVVISSQSPKSVDLAVGYGAGRVATETDLPELIVVCVPPAMTAKIVADELARYPNAVVTDVASVKGSVLHELQASGAPLERYVGSHPMAGRERGGAISGRADLFVGRPWVITSHDGADERGIDLVADLASHLGSAVVRVGTKEHDRAVALVSHVPQLVSSLLASRLVTAAPEDIALAGQGLRDTTRIAASDPELWLQILEANADEVLPLLQSFAADLSSLISGFEVREPQAQIRSVMEAGNIGVGRIPGKHGGKHTNYAQVIVMVEDRPGELARLLTEVGEIGINLEELQLEHSPSAQIGLAELYVAPTEAERLTADLVARGWRIA